MAEDTSASQVEGDKALVETLVHLLKDHKAAMVAVKFLIENKAPGLETMFERAVRLNEPESVAALLKLATLSNEAIRNAFILAIRLEYAKVVAELLSHKGKEFFDLDCRLHFASGEKKTVLHWAVVNTDTAMVRVLLKYGSDPNIRSSRGETPLHRVGINSFAAKLLIEYKADPNIQNNIRLSPLHVACIDGHLITAEKLHGADPDVRDSLGKTPLHHACIRGHLSVIKWLLKDAGAHTESRDYKGRTPLHCACRSRHLTVIKWLIKEGGVDSGAALHHACWGGYLSIVEWLIKEVGADPNARDDGDTTPLHYACEGGRLPVITWLIEEVGACPTPKTKRSPF